MEGGGWKKNSDISHLTCDNWKLLMELCRCQMSPVIDYVSNDDMDTFAADKDKKKGKKRNKDERWKYDFWCIWSKKCETLGSNCFIAQTLCKLCIKPIKKNRFTSIFNLTEFGVVILKTFRNWAPRRMRICIILKNGSNHTSPARNK